MTEHLKTKIAGIMNLLREGPYGGDFRDWIQAR